MPEQRNAEASDGEPQIDSTAETMREISETLRQLPSRLAKEQQAAKQTADALGLNLKPSARWIDQIDEEARLREEKRRARHAEIRSYVALVFAALAAIGTLLNAFLR